MLRETQGLPFLYIPTLFCSLVASRCVTLSGFTQEAPNLRKKHGTGFYYKKSLKCRLVIIMFQYPCIYFADEKNREFFQGKSGKVA